MLIGVVEERGVNSSVKRALDERRRGMYAARHAVAKDADDEPISRTRARLTLDAGAR
jgi:hypothetical protein